MNLLLLCHGRLSEFNSFELKAQQTVQYRGNFGTILSLPTAKKLVQALTSDPCISDQQLAMSVSGYNAQVPLEGPNSFRPDIDLNGDNDPQYLCFLMNMTSKTWLPLGANWRASLNEVVQTFQVCHPPLWLNLLCCTFIDGTVQQAVVDRHRVAKNWNDVLNQ